MCHLYNPICLYTGYTCSSADPYLYVRFWWSDKAADCVEHQPRITQTPVAQNCLYPSALAWLILVCDADDDDMKLTRKLLPTTHNRDQSSFWKVLVNSTFIREIMMCEKCVWEVGDTVYTTPRICCKHFLWTLWIVAYHPSKHTKAFLLFWEHWITFYLYERAEKPHQMRTFISS